MTDIINSLRRAANIDAVFGTRSLSLEAAEEIARLRAEIADIKPHPDCDGGCITICSGEGQLLREELKVSRLNETAASEAAADLEQTILDLRDQLAAAQAYGAKLHESLAACCREIRSLELSAKNGPNGVDGDGQWYYFTTTHPAVFDAIEKLAEVIAPSDATALRERLAAERERVIAAAKARYDHEVSAVVHHAKQYDAYDWHMARQAAMADMLDAIRALGGE